MNHKHSFAPSLGALARGGDQKRDVVLLGFGEHHGDVTT